MSHHPPTPRRNAFAFSLAVRQSPSMYIGDAVLRGVCLVGILVAFLLDGSAVWTLAVLVPAALGTWQGWGLQRAVLGDYIPKNAVLRWGLESAVGGHGRHTPNVPGLLEGASSITLALAVAVGMEPGPPALAALALAVVYAVSMFSAMFLDSANYNPHDAPFPGFELLRSLVGPLVTLLGCALVLPLWSGGDLLAPAAVCGLGLFASLRVREGDRLLAFAREEARVGERQAGRDDVLTQVHGALSLDIDRAVVYAATVRDVVPELYEHLQVASMQLQQLTALEDQAVERVDYPETLARAVRRIANAYGAHERCSFEPAELGKVDHDLCRVLLHDLVGNAAKAAASSIAVRLTLAPDSRLELTVEDDGRPFPQGTWLTPGSSLARLQRRLEQASGGLALRIRPDSKTVVAVWTPQEVEELGTDQ